MGLLHLREFQPFFIFGTASLQRILKKENKIFNVLDRADPPVRWRLLTSKGRLGVHLSENPGDAPSFIVTTIFAWRLDIPIMSVKKRAERFLAG